MSATADPLLPIGTLVLGYVGTLFTESHRDKLQERREERLRTRERVDQATTSRETFELDLLLRLRRIQQTP